MIKVERKSDIRTKLIEFTFDETQPDKALTDFATSFDIFPVVLLSTSDSGRTIAPSAIQYLKLFNDKFLPEIEMLCADEDGSLIDDFFPTDYDITLNIFVKSTAEDVYPIRMDFRITSYNPIQSSIESAEKKFMIKGILDVGGLHYTGFESFKDSTSYNVLENVSLKLGLGFATNMTNTDDNMTWINPADTYMSFIQNVTKRAYISDKSFVWSFIDFYYNLNFVDIEKELSDSPTDLQSLNSIFTGGEEEFLDLYLSTSDSLTFTNKYISKYNLNNKSVITNLKNGYQFSTRWFNKTDNTIEHSVIRENETPGDLIQLITDDEISEYNWDGDFNGKTDEDNVHKNYNLALTLNEFNISKLQKMSMVVTLQLVNFEVKRFQKILIDFISINLLNDDNGVKEKLSGYWLCTGINYNFKRNGGATQEITLVRRDLNLKYKELHDIRKALEKNN